MLIYLPLEGEAIIFMSFFNWINLTSLKIYIFSFPCLFSFRKLFDIFLVSCYFNLKFYISFYRLLLIILNCFS